MIDSNEKKFQPKAVIREVTLSDCDDMIDPYNTAIGGTIQKPDETGENYYTANN